MSLITTAVSATPDPTALPGSNVLQQIVNGAEAWALAICLLGAFVGAGLLGGRIPHQQPPIHSARPHGRADLAAAALVIGAAPGLVNFFEHLGATAK